MSAVGNIARRSTEPLHRTGWDFIAVALATAVASGLSFAYYRSAGLLLLHGDALSRLNIARRVFDSLDPGLVQLGVIWPPAPQVLMLPLIWVDPLWHSGIAGSIPSMAAFVGTAVYLYALGRRLTANKLGGAVAWLVFVTNPNMLYLQAVPLSESLMLLTMVAAAYHLAVWLQAEKSFHLIAAALWVLSGTMTRYEGWALVPGAALIVTGFTLARYRDRRRAEALALMFLVPAAFGALLWLLYSTIILGDPLYFAHGLGASPAQAKDFAKNGALLTKGSLTRTTLTYGWTVVDIVGLPVLCMAALGIVTMMARRVPLRQGAVVVMLFVPALVTIASLYFGAIFLLDPHSKPAAFLSTRYGILALPAIAIVAALPAALHRHAAVVLLVAGVSFVAFSYQLGAPLSFHSRGVDATSWLAVNYPVPAGLQPLVVAEGLHNYNASNVASALEATAWFRRNNDRRRRILISALANDDFMFYAGLPLRDYVFEGQQPYWDDEMRAPGTWAKWVVVQPNGARDQVALKALPLIKDSPRFRLAFENDQYQIYELVRPPLAPPAPACADRQLAALQFAGDQALHGAGPFDVAVAFKNSGAQTAHDIVLGLAVTRGSQYVSRIDFGNGQPWLVDGQPGGTLYRVGDVGPGGTARITLRVAPAAAWSAAGAGARVAIEARFADLSCLDDRATATTVTLAPASP